MTPLKRSSYIFACGVAASIALASAQVAVSPEVSLTMSAFNDCATCPSSAAAEGASPLSEGALPVDLSLLGHLTMPYRGAELTFRGNASSGPAADWLSNAPVLFSNGVSANQTAWDNHIATGPSFLTGLSWPSPVAPFQYAQDYVQQNPYLGAMNISTSQATSAFYSALGSPYSFYGPTAMSGPALGFYP